MERAVSMPSERKGVTVIKEEFVKQLETACAFYEAEEVSSPLFHAVKLLENDVIELERKGASDVLEKISDGRDFEAEIADRRYKYISSDLASAKVKAEKETLTKSDKIDRVLTSQNMGYSYFCGNSLLCIPSDFLGKSVLPERLYRGAGVDAFA